MCGTCHSVQGGKDCCWDTVQINVSVSVCCQIRCRAAHFSCQMIIGLLAQCAEYNTCAGKPWLVPGLSGSKPSGVHAATLPSSSWKALCTSKCQPSAATYDNAAPKMASLSLIFCTTTTDSILLSLRKKRKRKCMNTDHIVRCCENLYKVPLQNTSHKYQRIGSISSTREQVLVFGCNV